MLYFTDKEIKSQTGWINCLKLQKACGNNEDLYSDQSEYKNLNSISKKKKKLGLPWWLRGYSIYLQCGGPGIDPWVGKIPWRRKWQPTPVFLPGESHGWKSLVGYSPWGRKESDTTEQIHSLISKIVFTLDLGIYIFKKWVKTFTFFL